MVALTHGGAKSLVAITFTTLTFLGGGGSGGRCLLGSRGFAEAKAIPYRPTARTSIDLTPFQAVGVCSDQTPYLHFPHPETRKGRAFLSPDDPWKDSIGDWTDGSDMYDFDGMALKEEGWNPAPAYMRHPLAKEMPRKKQDPVKRQQQEQSYENPSAPYPPAAYIDVNNLTTIAIVAQATVERMQTWYENGLFEWVPWWQTPVLGMAYTSLDLALGNGANELLIRDMLVKNDGQGWMIDKYVDDQSWWGMFALRAHQAYPNETWLDLTKAISDNSSLYWDDTCGGGVLWLTYKPLIKNTITNGLYLGVLSRLYRYTGNSTYYQYTLNTLNWWLDWGFETTTGRVYDTITAANNYTQDSGSCNRTGLATWTYNSGAFLFGLTDMYYATGNTRLLDLARTIAYAAIRDFSDVATGVLTESCEHDPQPSPTLPPGCQQDEVLFKGILMLGMSELYTARPDGNIYNFINTQLLAATFNNLDDSWLFGEWWGGPWNETTAGPKTQINALCLLAAAATVNSDYLARLNRNLTVLPSDWEIPVPQNASGTGALEAGQTSHSDSLSGGSRLGSMNQEGRLFNALIVASLIGGGLLLGGAGILLV